MACGPRANGQDRCFHERTGHARPNTGGSRPASPAGHRAALPASAFWSSVTEHLPAGDRESVPRLVPLCQLPSPCTGAPLLPRGHGAVGQPTAVPGSRPRRGPCTTWCLSGDVLNTHRGRRHRARRREGEEAHGDTPLHIWMAGVKTEEKRKLTRRIKLVPRPSRTGVARLSETRKRSRGPGEPELEAREAGWGGRRGARSAPDPRTSPL